MDKNLPLEYDNYHKFLTSLGIILIILGILVPCLYSYYALKIGEENSDKGMGQLTEKYKDTLLLNEIQDNYTLSNLSSSLITKSYC